jgi:hypothetical protein
MKSQENAESIQKVSAKATETHDIVNSRMSEMIKIRSCRGIG